MSDIENIEPEKKGVSRRTVTKAMAWAVPVIAIATPVPAFAASGGPPGVAVGVACKLPGGSNANCSNVVGIPGISGTKGFAIPLRITNNTDKPIVLQPSITIASSGLPFTVVGISPAYCTVIPVNGVVDVIVYANSDNSANTPVTLDVTVPWGHDCDDTDHPPIVIEDVLISAFPPCSTPPPGGAFPQGPPTCRPAFFPRP